MKLNLNKMRFFSRDKQRKASSATSNGLSDSTSSEQQYLTLDSPTVPQFTRDTKNASTSSLGQSRVYRGLKGFGGRRGSSNSAGNGSGDFNKQRQRSASQPPAASSSYRSAPPRRPPARGLLQLPEPVLERIFAAVCPHSQDRSYEKCEDLSSDGACMLCDMRDLAHCVQVCRQWRPVAARVLYTSVRIDSVHYCDREAVLADRRKRRSFFDRNAEPQDTADIRLKLLCRALREEPTGRMGATVQFLKIPYMLRESNHADIARTVSVLPNLRYVDLPEGLFMDDPVYVTLKHEIQARCPELRKMTYMAGAERSLAALGSGTIWPKLEVLELVRIGMDPTALRQVLVALPNLRALKVTEAAAGPHAFSDEVLAPGGGGGGDYDGDLNSNGFVCAPEPEIAPLEELVLTDLTGLTTAGLQGYLSRPAARHALKVLTVSGTSVRPWSLPALLALAPALRHLTIVEQVSATLPVAAGTKDIRPLASQSLQTLNYEIKAADGVSPYAGVTRSYYNYLSGSIVSGGLTNLRAVYVCDAQFPDLLLSGSALPPPPAGIFGPPSAPNRPSTSDSIGSSPRFSMMSGRSSNSNLGLLQSPANMLSPPHSPGLRQSPQQRQFPNSANANPFVDPQALKPWTAGHNPRFSSNNPFSAMISPQQVRTLEVFTKGDDDLDWSSFLVDGGDTRGGGRGSPERPTSSYGLGAELGAGAGARRSVFLQTGAGDFLAVPNNAGSGAGGLSDHRPHSRVGSGGQGPDLWPRPKSSAGEKKTEQLDLWR